MLSKKVCKICYRKAWTKHEDKNWSNGKVFCLKEYVWFHRSIDRPPPDQCPYVLEQIISDQEL